jgi:hypothetical protein
VRIVRRQGQQLLVSVSSAAVAEKTYYHFCELRGPQSHTNTPLILAYVATLWPLLRLGIRSVTCLTPVPLFWSLLFCVLLWLLQLGSATLRLGFAASCVASSCVE